MFRQIHEVSQLAYILDRCNHVVLFTTIALSLQAIGSVPTEWSERSHVNASLVVSGIMKGRETNIGEFLRLTLDQD